MRTFRALEVEGLATISCDICGKIWDRDSSEGGPDFMSLRADWGYDSKKNFQVWTADICESCVDNYLVDKVNFVKVPREPLTRLSDLDIAKRSEGDDPSSPS